MVEPPQNVTISPGKTVKLTCVAHGYSSFDYVWENSYGNLSSNMRKMDTNRLELIEIAGQHLDISELVITNVDESDEGFYYCIANNTCGNDTASVWLEVDSKMHTKCYIAMYICDRICKKGSYTRIQFFGFNVV